VFKEPGALLRGKMFQEFVAYKTMPPETSKPSLQTTCRKTALPLQGRGKERNGTVKTCACGTAHGKRFSVKTRGFMKTDDNPQPLKPAQ